MPKIYKINAENLMLFCWITAQKQIIPTITCQQAIWNLFRFADIDDWDMESAMNTFFRLQKEYYKDCKNETATQGCRHIKT